MNSYPPVLADLDVGNILGIIFLVVSVLGWFVKVVKGQADEAPRPPVQRPEGERMRTEVETFLEEISAPNVKRPPAKANPPQRPAERPRPAASKSGKKSAKQQPVAKPKQAPKPIASLSEKHLRSSNLGEGVRAHVTDYMQSERIAAEVRQDLAGLIPAQVQAKIGRGASVSAVATSTAAAPVHPLITLLRNPQGIRQAIVLQEILKRPKSLQQHR